jgi:L-fucose isomerase-like protein
MSDIYEDIRIVVQRHREQAAAEEREKVVAWLEKNAKLNPHLPEAMALVLLFSQAITKEAHLK